MTELEKVIEERKKLMRDYIDKINISDEMKIALEQLYHMGVADALLGTTVHVTPIMNRMSKMVESKNTDGQILMDFAGDILVFLSDMACTVKDLGNNYVDSAIQLSDFLSNRTESWGTC